MTKKKLVEKISRLKPDEVSLNLGFITASYDTKREPNDHKVVKATQHMKELAQAGFAGVLLDAVSALRHPSSNDLSKVSPIRVGKNFPSGVMVGEILWLSSYAREIWSEAFDDFGVDDLNERVYGRRLKQEAEAIRYMTYANSHLQSYPEIYALILRLREMDKKTLALVKKVPSSYTISKDSPLYIIDPCDRRQHKIILKRYSFGTSRKSRVQPEKPLVDKLAKKLNAVENEKEITVRTLADQLLKLRLMVLNGTPLEGTCELCNRGNSS